MNNENRITVRPYQACDLPQMLAVWNEVVADGTAFPQEELLDEKTGAEFFALQSCTSVAVDESGNVRGLYILHPNNVGRCGHICNASYAVASDCRGQHIGEMLIADCLKTAKNIGFKLLQFNAVVETNTHARHLYEKMGFRQLGTIPNGFRMKDGHYENICPYYIELDGVPKNKPRCSVINNEAFLSNDSRFTSFTYGDTVIRFKTSDKLEKYTKIIEWDHGYIVVNAVYNGVEVEEYIDLIPILENLCIEPDEFLKNIERVSIRYD